MSSFEKARDEAVRAYLEKQIQNEERGIARDNIYDAYESGADFGYGCALKENALGDKVDRNIECIVIDWLQWSESFDNNRAQNALTVLSFHKKRIAELEGELNKIVAALNRIAIVGMGAKAYTSDFTNEVNDISRKACLDFENFKKTNSLRSK